VGFQGCDSCGSFSATGIQGGAAAYRVAGFNIKEWSHSGFGKVVGQGTGSELPLLKGVEVLKCWFPDVGLLGGWEEVGE
jgi:hypothetical protein